MAIPPGVGIGLNFLHGLLQSSAESKRRRRERKQQEIMDQIDDASYVGNYSGCC